MSQPDAASSEMFAEPDWLAAEPTDRAKLTAIMAAVRRCYAECPIDPRDRSGPHMTAQMAELFIGQLMILAEDRIHDRALRLLAADLAEEADAITTQDEPPWAAMYGLKVTSGAEAAVILRRAAELALRRADGRPELPGPVAPGAPQPAVRAGDNSSSERDS